MRCEPGLVAAVYDVVVVGAGPAGSQTAYRLAQRGHRVAVFEAREAIGSKVCCTGIVSRECFELFSPDDSALLRKTSAASFFIPSGRQLRLERDTVQAYIIDRAAFDMALAKRAKEAGAEYLLGSKVTHLLVRGNSCQVGVDCNGRKEVFQARAAVIGCGFPSAFPRQLGMGQIVDFLLGAQTEVNTGISEVEVYLDVKLTPGGFGWLVPTSHSKGLVGVMSRRDAHSAVTGLVSRLSAEGKISPGGFEIRQKAIPLGCLPHSYADRAVAVGEVAGQVKPTTGGGIYFGLLGAEAAADAVHQGFLLGDLTSRLLSRYQQMWQAKIGAERFLGMLLRRLYESLSPGQIERVFDALASGNIHEQLLGREAFSFDRHSGIIFEALKEPRLLAALVTPRFLLSPASVVALLQLILRRKNDTD